MRRGVLNIGNNRSETVRTLVSLLEEGLGRAAVIEDLPRPAADVTDTFADISAIKALTGFTPDDAARRWNSSVFGLVQGLESVVQPEPLHG